MAELSSVTIPDAWLGHFDMLRDERRNKAYQRGVQSLIGQSHGECGKEEYWIDIGCGSGLLGCLVGKYLGKKVIAFECVPKLAKIARETIRRNSLQETVTVWLVHTSDLDSQFMERTFGERASYVISELLDTTLLGEGLYEGMTHAYSHLLQQARPAPGPQRVTSLPHFARVFIQVISPSSSPSLGLSH
jgi:predicted RNA methylase